MRDHVTYVPTSVRERLREVADGMKTGGVNGAVELVLRASRGILLEQVARGFPDLLDYLDEEWVRLPLTLDRETKAEIETVSDRLPIRRMYVVGVLLAAKSDILEELVMGGRALGTRTAAEEPDDVAVEVAS